VLTDISRLKSQQAELEAWLRERELMFSLSRRGHRLPARRGASSVPTRPWPALTGYAAPELTALDGPRCTPTRALRRVRAAAGHSAAHGRPLQRRTPLRRRDGSLLLGAGGGKRPVDEADPDAGVICSYVDVDERYRAREAVQLQAERTRAILDSVLVGIVTVGPTAASSG
jgi:PAS domain-containing protein